jgi:hypothetical protein
MDYSDTIHHLCFDDYFKNFIYAYTDTGDEYL